MLRGFGALSCVFMASESSEWTSLTRPQQINDTEPCLVPGETVPRAPVTKECVQPVNPAQESRAQHAQAGE